MSVKWHVNNISGEVGKCSAEKSKCPYGGNSGKENHYTTKKEAIEKYESIMSSHYSIPFKKSSKTTKTITSNDLKYTRTHLNDLESRMFNIDTIRGNLNNLSFDQNSYKLFGFISQEDNYERYEDRMRNYFMLNNNDLLEQSKNELANATNEQKASVLFYTGSAYDYMNEFLYNKKIHSDLSMYNISEDSNNIFEEEHGETIVNLESIGRKENIIKVCHHIDEVFQHSPMKQKIVYRSSHARNLIPGVDWKKHFQYFYGKEFALGNEVKWDGYVSTSADSRYISPGEGNIIFEILTPEGVNITSISDFKTDEAEILLPRGTRYRVVGSKKMKHKNYKGIPYFIRLVQLVAVNNYGDILDGTNSDTLKKLS